MVRELVDADVDFIKDDEKLMSPPIRASPNA